VKWRLLDLGVIEPYETDTIKEGLLIAIKKDLIPNTLCFAVPKRVVWIGPRTNLEKRVNLEYCRKESIPIIRDLTGAGPSALDEDTLIYALASRERVPDTECIFHAIKAMGLEDCVLSESNDVLVSGQKIVGTLGRIFPSGIYVAGGVIAVDFNPEFCEKALLTPTDLFAGKEAKSHREWVTTLKTKLGREVSYGEVISAIKVAFEAELDAKFEVAHSFTEVEEQIREELKDKYRSESWLKLGKWSPVKDYGR